MFLISVIIPTFNASPLLVRTLDSLRKQSWQGFEVIIQDGLSVDDTVETGKKFKSFFGTRLHIYSEKDNGIYDAMNKAIRKANGSWLYFLGSDDFLFDNHSFERLLPELNNSSIEILFGNVSTDGNPENRLAQASRKGLLKSNICHQGIFYRRNVFKKLGLYNTRYKLFADWDFNLKAIIANIPFRVVNNTIAFYNTTGASCTLADPLFHRELCFKLPFYSLKYGESKEKGKWIIPTIRGYLVLLKKNFVRPTILKTTSKKLTENMTGQKQHVT